jgi:5-hydroxyisourate hydrolase-like protein (transthyretin family)
MSFTRLRIVSALAFACAASSLACSDSTSVSPVGKLSAQVVDATGAGVQGVNADLYKVIEGNSVLWRASLTSSDGIAVFGASEGGVAAGDYFIHLSFINGYKLAANEANDKTVTVSSGDDNVVTFHAVSAGPGPR